MSYYPNIITMDAMKRNLPVYSGRGNGVVNMSTVFATQMWTGQNVMSAYGLIAAYNNEKHNYANNSSFVPNNLNYEFELLIQWKQQQQNTA